MAKREDIENALQAWRDAERRLDDADGMSRDQLESEVARTRGAYQQLAADHMAEQLDKLKAAERERAESQPSTPPYHEAAKEEADIASEIWSDAVDMDRRTPRRGKRRRDDGGEGPEPLQN
jgi:hypothetical protein